MRHGIASTSQFGEDIWLLNHFMNVPRDDLVCIEVGAFDGVSYSNTFVAETLLGAKCILVEPSPRNAESARRKRPGSQVVEVGVGARVSTGTLIGDRAVSGLSNVLSTRYIEHWKLGRARKHTVRLRPFYSILTSRNVSHIDFLSIDVQGGELEVLETMDWEVPVGCIAIELEGQSLNRDNRCRQILREQQFQLRVILGVTEIWINSDNWRRAKIFQSRQARYSPWVVPFQTHRPPNDFSLEGPSNPF